MRRDLAALRARTAADVMSKPLVTVYAHQTIEHVARLFIDRRVSSVAVLNELEQPVGVLTTTDLALFAKTNAGQNTEGIISATSAHPAWPSVLERMVGTVSPWMSRRVHAVAPSAPLKEVVHQMLKRHLHHLFVKNADGKGLQGIVTTTDLVRELATFL